MATAYPGGLRKRGGLLDYEDTIKPTPRNPFLGGVADLLGQAYKLPEMPRLGVPGLDFVAANRNRLLDMLNIGDVQKTAEALAYGNRLGTGRGMTYQPLPETIGAAMAVAPFAGKAIRATEGLPVGASIKSVGDDIFNLSKQEFLGKPKITKNANASELKPIELNTLKDVEPQPFMGGKYQIKMNEDGAVVFDKGKRIASYNFGDTLVVDKPYRKSGIAQELVYEWRTSFPAPAVATERTKASQAIQEKVWERIQNEKQSLPEPSPYPQQAALNLAQQRAALPVEQGGLGLLESNTAMDRAKAMGGKDMVHFSRAGGDYATLDSGKFAIAPFDAVGTHVGTPQAAMDRFRNTTATTDQIKGTTYPVTILGDRPMMNQNGMPWGEDDLSAFLRQQGGHNWSDIQGGKMTYQDMNAGLRKKLFEDQGYTSIPYYNEVEGKGSISYIVPPENIRSRFAAFDPFRRTAATAAAMGVAAPDLLAAETPEELKRRQLRGLLAP